MDEQISKALEVLKAGGIILYPTDTVWGIGCDATNAEAVSKIYALKQRDDRMSMIVLVDSIDSVARWVRQVPEVAWQLFEVADSPLTLVLPQGAGLAANLLPEGKTVAIRVPNHEFCKRLIRKLGRPLVSTSANIHGNATPQSFAQIDPQISQGVDYVVSVDMEQEDATGKPSSIVRVGLTGEIEILRA